MNMYLKVIFLNLPMRLLFRFVVTSGWNVWIEPERELCWKVHEGGYMLLGYCGYNPVMSPFVRAVLAPYGLWVQLQLLGMLKFDLSPDLPSSAEAPYLSFW